MSFQVFCPVPVGSIKFSLLCHIAWHETKNREKSNVLSIYVTLLLIIFVAKIPFI